MIRIINISMEQFHIAAKITRLIALGLFFTINVAYAQNELDVIRNNWLHYSDAPNSLYHYLAGQAYEILKKRADVVSEINSIAAWQSRQQWIKSTLLDIVGPFPEKNPLNAKIIRTIEKDGYRIEHIVYESQPGFFVTSSMFIPAGLKKKEKYPAVIYCSGHSAEGYRSAVYLHICANLAKKGFIVFAFDPVGQGERYEYLDPGTGKSLITGINEHSYSGLQAFVTGSSQARYMIWDGIRAVDYLLTRKEVDPSRIGITGRSGGGTQSSYIAAMDDRIYAAAPENYLTNFTRLLQTIGPQDAEQNMLNIISRGLDHADLLLARVPKPALMITTTRDIFSIQGVLETEKEVTRIYKLYGKGDNFIRIEDDAPHESTKKNREAMYAFFQKFLNNPGDPEDLETQPFTPEEIRVTETGQVSTSLGGETVFSLNRMDAGNVEINLEISRKDPAEYQQGILSSAKKLSGYMEPSFVDSPVLTGRIQKEGYAIEKYFVKGEGDYVIPYLLMIPASSNNKALIFLHPSGKSVEAVPGGEAEWFVKNGITVLAPDLLGLGETGPATVNFNHAYIQKWLASMLIGRSIVGVHAADVVRLAGLLKNISGITEVYGIAYRGMSPALLHAAAFCRDITRIALVEPYSSYLSFVENRFYNIGLIYSMVPRALKKYDLPDLAASIAPRKLMMANITDCSGKVSEGERLDKDIAVIKTAYRSLNASGQLNIILREISSAGNYDLYKEWMK